MENNQPTGHEDQAASVTPEPQLATDRTPELLAQQKHYSHRGAFYRKVAVLVGMVMLLLLMGLHFGMKYLKRSANGSTTHTAAANQNPPAEVIQQRDFSGLTTRKPEAVASGAAAVKVDASASQAAVGDSGSGFVEMRSSMTAMGGSSSYGAGSGAQAMPVANTRSVTASAPVANKPAAGVDEAQSISLDPNLYIAANTYIPCVLNTRLVSTVTGTVRCTVAQDVYSANGHTKLIEKGTKVDGSYESGSLRQGDNRIFVVWNTLTTPDFKRIYLSKTGATGELGEAGLGGWVDNHFWQRFGGAMMLSMVQDSLAVAAKQGVDTNGNIDYTANSRDAFAEMAKIALQNTINIPPTLYKNQGEVVGVMTGQDMDFSKVYRLQRVQHD